jgi:hypothetical protein
MRVEIENIPPVVRYAFEVDLRTPGLIGIAGDNGTGKTTLAKALLNLSFADTFIRTSSASSITSDSRISYHVGDQEFRFEFDASTRTLTTRAPVPDAVKRLLSVELPAPHGQRFTFFGTLIDADPDIRRAVVLGQHTRPQALIDFLNAVYCDDRFDELVEIRLRRGICYCILLGDDRYLREDHFSSGEYFLIHLFRLITAGRPLVFIDDDRYIARRTSASTTGPANAHPERASSLQGGVYDPLPGADADPGSGRTCIPRAQA